MRKLTILLAVFIMATAINDIHAQAPYLKKVYVDPGHGGPGASQYGINGDGEGTVGPSGLTEQWVNLQVGLEMYCELWDQDFVEEQHFKFSRLTDTTHMDLDDRVTEAATWGAQQYISIHHNGLSQGSEQGTEVVWCDRPTFDDGTPRPGEAWQDTLARKTRYRLLEEFRYQDRCWVQDQLDRMTGCCDCYSYHVTRNVMMANVITEASDISFHADEESLFVNIFSGHAAEEAIAILDGWKSYCDGQGLGRVDYIYLTDDHCWIESPPPTVYVSLNGGEDVEYEVPYETCLLLREWTHICTEVWWFWHQYRYRWIATPPGGDGVPDC